MPPSYVKAYLKRSKNDANDAAAICEAVTRPSMRFVPTKSEQQQSGLMLHRSRQLLVRQRTMLSNAIRGHLAELGIISAKGRNGTAELFKIIADEKDARIPAAARFSLDVLARQHATIAAEIGAIEKRIHAWQSWGPISQARCPCVRNHGVTSRCQASRFDRASQPPWRPRLLR
jgi:transposase